MMSLEEAIKHCEEEAVKRESDVALQLADWLKELKKLRKIYMNGYEEGYKDAKELYS